MVGLHSPTDLLSPVKGDEKSVPCSVPVCVAFRSQCVICHIPFLLPPVTGNVPEKGSVSMGSVLGQYGVEPSPKNEQHAV